jgi:hypothetical protein
VSRAVLVEALDVLTAELPRLVEMATQEERAAVVATLRRTSNHAVDLDSIADAIERGEHRREEKP